MATLLKPLPFSQLDGWIDDDHAAAMQAFLKTARQMVEKPYQTKALDVSSAHLAVISTRALALERFDDETARLFFETHFQPCEIIDTDKTRTDYNGFVTAYYEPEIAASRVKTDIYQAPLYSRPDDLIDVPASYSQRGLDENVRFARLAAETTSSKPSYEAYPDREAIENGYLKGQELEIAWVKDKVEALFIQIQGSARLRFDNGEFTRVGYAAKSGHPYTAVGKVLLDQGSLSREDCGMRAIRDWFQQNPDQVDAVINQNRSFIFFQEYPVNSADGSMQEGPIGAAKVALTRERSLAVDKSLHTFGTPLWIDCEKPLPGQQSSFQKLMIAQDTGSAIIGSTRGDLFLGSGDAAGAIAGDVRHAARFIVLAPKQVN